MDKEKALTFIGYSFVLVWILAFFEEFPYFGSLNFLWFCKISFLLLGIACIKKDSAYLLAFWAPGLLPETIWMIDFLSEAMGSTFIGSTSFMFEYGESPFNFALNLLHLVLIPAALLLSARLPMKEGGKKIILLIGMPMLSLSYLFSDLNIDINCVYNLCYPTPLGLGISPFIVMIAYGLVCAFLLEPAIRRFLEKTSKKKLIVSATVIGIVAIVGIVAGIIQYSHVPHYTCESNEKVMCERFFMDRTKNLPFLQFSVKDKEGEECYIDWMIDGTPHGRQNIPVGDDGKHDTIYIPPFDSGKRKITSEMICE